MRPLCGAIITAGALVGLGLFSQGYGARYAAYAQRDESGHFDAKYWVTLGQMDTPLIILLVLLVATLIIGLAVAFVGLAYHHHNATLSYYIAKTTHTLQVSAKKLFQYSSLALRACVSYKPETQAKEAMRQPLKRCQTTLAADPGSRVPLAVTVHGSVKKATKIHFYKEGRKAGRNGQFNSCFPALLIVFVLWDFVRGVNGCLLAHSAKDLQQPFTGRTT